jgi:hypothetical protein
VFSAEMPDEPSHVIAPLDGDTAERLLSGRLDPDDAPPGYAEVARLLRAAAAPADESELTGQAAAMNAFRARPRRVEPPGRPARPPTPGGVRGRRGGVRGRVPGGRGRLVALALAGVVAAAGLGVWTAGGAPFSGELGSPSGGPSAGGPGSETPGSGVNGAGAGAAGSLRPLWPGLSSGAGTARVADGRPPALPTPSERAAARHGGGVTARGGGPAHGSKPTGPDKQTRPSSKPPKSPKPKAPEPKAPEPKAPEPKATNGHVSRPKGAKG